MTGPLTPDVLERAARVAAGARLRALPGQDALEAEIEAADAAVTNHLAPAALARARRLRWVQSWAAGPDALLHPAMVASAVTVTSCRGNGAVPLAEHALMLMLAVDRRLPRLMAAQAAGGWDRFSHGELAGRACGIIGTGHCGADLAAKAHAFRMRTLGLRRREGPAPAAFDALYTRERLHEFLAASDFVVVTAPFTAATAGMLGAAEFAAMRRGAIYVCISRGGIARDDALLAALRSGHLAGAGLDAHAVEPLPADSPFRALDNVIVTPHMGAVTAGTRARGEAIVLENLGRFVRGESLVNVVDKVAGY
ncbi:MAG: D-2-hydroxyacid dehydrogenase [Rhodobacteraceae bacterium]|nr:D-2-hydroxyacid dehydrogenase [Paracoccaceae bacterium]